MNKCQHCGTEFEGKFCPECGAAAVAFKTCPNCRATLHPNVKFCPECGYGFYRPASAPAQPYSPPAPQTARKSEAAQLSFFTKAVQFKIFEILRFVPSVLLLLFAVLAFGFLGAPALKGNFFGLVASENAYEVLNDASADFLHGSVITLIVAAACSVLVAAGMGLYAYAKHKNELDYCDFIPFPVYLTALIAGSVLIALVKKEDDGAGVFSAGSCPTLFIVFAIVFALFTAGAVLGRYFLFPNVKSLIKQKEQEKQKRYKNLPADLTPPQKVKKPDKGLLKKKLLPPVVKTANRYVSLKALPWIFILGFIFCAPAVLLLFISWISNDFSVFSGYYPVIYWAIYMFAIVCFFAVAIPVLVLSLKKRVSYWERNERSPENYTAALIVSCLFTIPVFLLAFLLLPGALTSSNNISKKIAIIALFSIVGCTLLFIFPSALSLARRAKVNKLLFGTKKPNADEEPQQDFEELNREYLKYQTQKEAYLEYELAQTQFNYRRRRYINDRDYEEELPEWRAKFRTQIRICNKKAIAGIAVALAALVALPCILFPVLTNVFRAGAVEDIGLGGRSSSIEVYLPEPDVKTNSTWEYYGKNCLKLVKQMNENNEKLANITDFEELGNLMVENQTLTEQMRQLTYKYLALSFDSYGDLTSVVLDTARCAAKEDKKKTVKRIELGDDNIYIYTSSYYGDADENAFGDFCKEAQSYLERLSARIYYKDGSYQNAYLPSSAYSKIDLKYLWEHIDRAEYSWERKTTQMQCALSWADEWGEYEAPITFTIHA